jgi:hypothetical protein
MNKSLLVIVIALVAWVGVSGADQPSTSADIVKLVQQLGSEDYAERESAMKQLEKMPAAIPALREAANGSDKAEVRGRATAILKVQAAFAATERFKKQQEYAKQRQVDRLIESVVAWREAVRDEERLLIRQFARDVLADLTKEFGPTIPKVEVYSLLHPSWKDKKLPLTIGGKIDKAQDETGLTGDVVAEFIHKVKGGYGISVSRDGAESEAGHGGPVYLANGSVRCFPETLRGASRSLVIINGDFTADKVVLEGDIIICTGNVSLDHAPIKGSLIIAGGEIDAHGFATKDTRLFPKEKKVAELFKWYDAAAEGLHVEVADKKVTVAKVDAGKPFAAAGLQPGDRLLRVNDQPVTDLRGLNRYLCRAEVGYTGAAVIAVVRGEKVVEVNAKLAK